ncbi:MAG: hypothetical protein A2583_07835 [Bdellovibrionales bacterium RIFOXYD1_FULL_53_11]|nr:MAG: hypothetical protein A2583_07835 [Bdellovibrionales bacterium RIFOXYD1_FULL_53_11]
MAVAAALVLSGCANDYSPRGGAYASKDSMKSANFALAANDYADPAFSCPAEANVTPDYDSALNGTGYYKVCAALSGTATIKVIGTASAGTNICVFPVEIINNQTWLKPDQTGAPMYQCVAASSSAGTQVSFSATSFNAVFIVSGEDASQMVSCLQAGTYLSCPDYSYGKFR